MALFETGPVKNHINHPLTSPDYARLIFLLQNSPTSKSVAEKLGVSERTIRRWKHDGIPPRAYNRHHDDLVRVAANRRRSIARKLPVERAEPKPVYFISRGAKFVFVAGLPLDALWDITLWHANHKDGTAFHAYRVKFRLDGPFTGRWDGDTATVGKGDSWLIKTEHASTMWQALQGDPDEILGQITHYDGQAHLEIQQLVFAITRPDQWEESGVE